MSKRTQHLTKTEIDHICYLFKNGWVQSHIAQRFGVTDQTIYKILIRNDLKVDPRNPERNKVPGYIQLQRTLFHRDGFAKMDAERLLLGQMEALWLRMDDEEKKIIGAPTHDWYRKNRLGKEMPYDG